MPAVTAIKSALVLGAGGWGTALANTLVQGGLEVQFWGRDESLMHQLKSRRLNDRYLPGIALDERLRICSRSEEIRPADLVLFVVPSKGIGQTAAAFAQLPALQAPCILLSCTKGIDQVSLQRPSELLHAFFPRHQVAVLTGPNHAEEVGRAMATAAVVASQDHQTSVQIQTALNQPWLRLYTSDDICGAEWCGVLKNCYAIAAGIASGLGLGDNATAALVTRALAEMTRLVSALGGKTVTCQGLAGIGDLMATCYSSHSRNRELGREIGRGRSLSEITGGSHTVAEGVVNSASLRTLAGKLGVNVPILTEVDQILRLNKPPALAMRDLLTREPRPESDC